MFEAMLEYFVSILVSGTFLTAILLSIGVSQSVAGVVTSLATFSCVAQFVSIIFIRPKGKTKRLVTVMHLVNQLMFALLYLIPHISLPQSFKVACFAVMYLCGYLIHNAVQPFKLDWLMSYVPDNKRGSFTANKEIMSLIGGMLFSFLMGCVIDGFKNAGHENVGFILSGITIFVLCILHLVSLLVVKDPENYACTVDSESTPPSIASIFKFTLLDKKFNKIILLDIIWQTASTFSTAYFNIYIQGSMAITVTTMTVISALQFFVRILVSRFFGRLADRAGWANMLSVSYLIGAVGFVIFAFASPENCFTLPIFGGVRLNAFVILYNIIYGVYMAGANSGLLNITFDYVSHENRRYAIGAKSAVGGLFGFLASLVASPFVAFMQKNGNRVFGITVYAQQIMSLISAVIFVAMVIYIKKVIIKMRKE